MITIIGAGAIGGVLGAYLAKGGEEVVFCDIEEEHVVMVREEGIRIEGPDEEFQIRVDAYTPEELLNINRPLDWVFICTKAQHSQGAIEKVIPLLNNGTKVVSFQNGLTDLKIPPHLNVPTPLLCFVNFSADYLEPGRILYGGVSSVSIGEFDGKWTNRLLELKALLENWGPVTVTGNIPGYLWSKLSYASLLYATALVDETMAAVVFKKELRPTLIELCAESLEVAHLQRIKLKSFDVWKPESIFPRENQIQQKLDKEWDFLAEWMSKNKKQKSGIWRDLAIRHRITEVDFDLTPIVARGRHYNLSLPLTQYVISSIKEIEVGKREMDWQNLYQLKHIYENKIKQNRL
ncbi:2-dehydropantoate 2-reductase [Neobacillus novalis]|uniref:2-dehydropantoate 2-reductase n=1 Tax=Neobacillus novalis TaxID=220687 RepID=A0AA95SAV0_9BACI|nr:2-dehydropantoate 2-reductase [Neobacillus novalis]WHY88515.1 2-dehydropantoate 2-reductase [Neobacillus novalis]